MLLVFGIVSPFVSEPPCSPELGYMHTSLMLVCGWMEENTLPCSAQRGTRVSGLHDASFHKRPNTARMFKAVLCLCSTF